MQQNIFQAFKLCPLNKIKVVILGQDPYHQKGQAIGLAFAVRHGFKPPPSLRNIYKEIKACFDTKKEIANLNLSSWAEQGVLLLNTVLTVEDSKAFSHRDKGWEIFTDRVIQVVSETQEKVIFLLWGKPAQKKSLLIDSEKHVLFECSHPSPLSATRTKTPFIGSNCFKTVNQILKENKHKEIEWI